MTKNQILVSICLWIVVKSSYAITLNKFVSDVIQSNPQVLQRVHSYRQVVEDERIASSGWLPSVDLAASVGSYKTVSPLIGGVENNYGSHDVSLTLTQNLFNGFDTTHSEKQARARINSELYRVFDEADNVAILAIGYYMDALKQRRLLELAERNVKSHEEILQQLHDRNYAGAGRLSEEEQTIGRLAQAQAGLLAQTNNLEDSLTRMHFTLGRYVSADELVNPDVPVMPEEELDVLLDKALDHHPAMKSANFNIKASEHNYKRASSGYYPKVDFQIQKLVGDDISGFDGPTDDLSAVINMSYNLYKGGADKAGQRKGLSVVYENREFAVKVKRQILETLRLAWMASKALRSQSKYLDTYVEKSDTTTEYYRAEFVVGKRDLLDLLDIEGEFNTAMVRRAKAIYDGVTEVFRVYEATGQLFTALNLDVELTKDNLRLVEYEVAKIDMLPLNDDLDLDRENDLKDHCDNTLEGKKVNIYGCHTSAKAEFKYSKIEFDDSHLIIGEVNRKQLNFIYRTEELTDESFAILKEVILDLKNLSTDTTIEIYAHTDSRASKRYNQKLSQKRADAIKNLLVLSGIDADRILAIGKGELEPIADNDTDEGRAQNRRVEFLVKKIQKIDDEKKPSSSNEGDLDTKVAPVKEDASQVDDIDGSSGPESVVESKVEPKSDIIQISDDVPQKENP